MGQLILKFIREKGLRIPEEFQSKDRAEELRAALTSPEAKTIARRSEQSANPSGKRFGPIAKARRGI